jgi:hypothetical protein
MSARRRRRLVVCFVVSREESIQPGLYLPAIFEVGSSPSLVVLPLAMRLPYCQ